MLCSISRCKGTHFLRHSQRIGMFFIGFSFLHRNFVLQTKGEKIPPRIQFYVSGAETYVSSPRTYVSGLRTYVSRPRTKEFSYTQEKNNPQFLFFLAKNA